MGTSDDEHGRVSWTTPGDVEQLVRIERDMTRYFEHTDAGGTRMVVHLGRVSIVGQPSLVNEDGSVAIGIDLPLGVKIISGS